jgi:predicted ester cyclase
VVLVGDDAPPDVPRGLEGLRQIVTMLRTAFPDLHYETKEVIAESDWVAARTILYGTHNGPFFGIPPTGRRVVQEQMHLIRFANGKGVEHRAVRDDLGLLRQLGVIPERV